MRVTKCDLCKKEIEKEPITIRFGFYENVEFCSRCASPVLEFLKKHKFPREKEKNFKKA